MFLQEPHDVNILEDGILHSVRRDNLKSCLRSLLRVLVTAKVFPSSPSLVTLMMKAIRSSETSVLT
jgi:hypothetical protein